jgi:bile acid transporter
MEITLPEKILLVLLGFVIMLVMGAGLSLKDFKNILKNPKGLFIGFASQFGWMPLIAFLMAKYFNLEAHHAIGLIMLGCTPGGTSSNFCTHFAKGDTALSISMTLASTALAIVMMPLLLWLYTRGYTATGFHIPFLNIFGTLLIVTVPVLIGMWINTNNPARARKIEKYGNIFGITVLVSICTLWIPKIWKLLNEAESKIIIPSLLLAFLGFGLGYLGSLIMGMKRKERKAIALETGMQNPPITFTVIALSFPADMGLKIMTIPLFYGAFVMQNGLLVAFLMRFFDRDKYE